ncbi:relaxase/mobilization nuclease domain-containing protein [Sediminibacterium soli]|uniref:relaxase/mobilization nuclease domain-containing protein n=1 Tax=Sediminibacterium soli TaxID=2698829 RepID=UPI00137A441A|nr:relaxase/mobilization nuclease domain-containing protein [Sediminibacterium soli]NCI45018.1 relaxase/mobilization nuclease domain-containing protein [Sediminibacterium soli]
MISKVIKPGKTFAGACRYLCADRMRAGVILSEGIRDYDHKLTAVDFESQRRLNPNLKSPVQHIILSWCAGEKLTDQTMAEICLEYLKRMQVSNTQFLIVRHKDRDNPHVHILFNRVDNDGRTIKDNFIGFRGKKIAQQLTHEYGLIPAVKKDLQRTKMERLNDYDATRYEIFQALNDALPKCRTFEELKARLEKEKIGMVYKYKGKTNEVQGISFVKGDYKYKGSEIDRSFSYGNIIKQLGQRREQSQRSVKEHQLSHGTAKDWAISHALDIARELLKHEEEYNQLPSEFLKRNRKQHRL